MRSVDDARVVEALAASLGANGSGSARQRIRNHVRARIDALVQRWPVRSLEALQLLVANELGVCLEALNDDVDLRRIAAAHASFSPFLLRLLRDEFLSRRTEGVLLRHPEPRNGDLPYLAVIDMRGERRVRGYFTAWHELAHLLIVPPGNSLGAVQRSIRTRRRDPLESVADEIAGLVGFYEPLFLPVLKAGSEDFSQLTITGLERIRDQTAPRASLHATAVAAVQLAPTPMAFICAKPEERGTTTPLVIQSVALSPSAVTDDWSLVPEMLVDDRSCLGDALRVGEGCEIARHESQRRWRHPRGMRCKPAVAMVVAAQRGPVVYALLREV